MANFSNESKRSLQDKSRVTHIQWFGGLLAESFQERPDTPGYIKNFNAHVEAFGLLLVHLPNCDP
eukprot:7403608-Pyramimonas_sp.AAC.1